jgi:hypothetical protein
MTYTVYATLLATFEIEAASQDEARRIVKGICVGGKITVTEDAENRQSIAGICDVEGSLSIEAPIGCQHRDDGRGVCIDCGAFLPSSEGKAW